MTPLLIRVLGLMNQAPADLGNITKQLTQECR
jgi:hypothetical protein